MTSGPFAVSIPARTELLPSKDAFDEAGIRFSIPPTAGLSGMCEVAFPEGWNLDDSTRTWTAENDLQDVRVDYNFAVQKLCTRPFITICKRENKRGK